MKSCFSPTTYPLSKEPFPPLPTNSTNSPFPYLSLLEKCSNLIDLKKIHAHTIIHGLARFTYITSRFLAFYALNNNGNIDYACQIFDRLPTSTIFNWNTMIKGFSKSLQPEKGLLFYTRMRTQGFEPNMHTFPFVIKSCVNRSSLSQIHGHIFKFGLNLDVYVTSSLINGYCRLGDVDLASRVFDESSNKNVVCWTSLISGYCRRGLVHRAREVFNQVPDKSDVSWSAMVAGYVQNEQYKEAIELFRDLKGRACVKLNGALLVSVLSACAASGVLEEGRWIHSYIDREIGLEYGLEEGTALVNFYAKCGSIECAREVFDRIARKDVMAWGAMIMGLALNGHTKSAIDAFFDMIRSNVTPNAITFIGLLTACNHGGLVDEGQKYFEDMTKVHCFSPTIEHYGCMVDLLSRSGLTAAAERLVKGMPMEPDGAIWGALLNGCVVHGHVELGEKVGKHVIELEPRHCGRYVGLANVYATMGRWEGVVKVRRAMRERGVATTPAWSLIEINGVGHRFLADDQVHPQLEEIYKMMWSWYYHALGQSTLEIL